MNAPTRLAPDALALAAHNEAVLRALLDAPIHGGANVAKAAGVEQKNIDRALSRLLREGLVETLSGLDGKGWEITASGRLALRALDLAGGHASPPTADGPAADLDMADPDMDVIMLAHHQLRPNPLQPRQHFDRDELAQLKAAVVAARGVLQNLVVFPADVDGVHTISDGERRWRVVGELIEEGMWPADRRLKAVQRDNTPGQVAFIGLATNSQVKLSNLEQARAYAALTADTGWSARNAALQTGRDPRSVQQMLQVLREATPEDLARHEASPEAYTWEDLRKSVQEPAPSKPEKLAWTPKPDHALVLAEVAHAILHRPHPIYADSTEAGRSAQSDRLLGDLALHGFAMWASVPAATRVLLTARGHEWLAEAGASPAAPLETLFLFRHRAGLSQLAMTSLERDGRYATDWLNLPATPVRSEPATDALARRPIAEPVQRPLRSVEELALLELAHAANAACAAGIDHGGGWVRCRKYWNDQAASDLKAMGLIDFSHQHAADGPHVGLLPRGLDRLLESFPEAIVGGVTAEDLDAAREACGLTEWAGPGYVTPWLNEGGQPGVSHAPGVVTEDDAAQAESRGDDDAHQLRLDADEGRDEDALDTLVDKLRDAYVETRGRDDRWNRLPSADRAKAAVAAVQRGDLVQALVWLTGLLDAQKHDDRDHLGAAALGDLDEPGDDPVAKLLAASEPVRTVLLSRLDPGSRAFNDMVAYYPAWSEALGKVSWARKHQAAAAPAAPAPLFTLDVGDVVSVGGTASGYRLPSVARESGLSGPAFMAQQVRLDRGKDYGKPRTITLHAIQHVVRRAAADGEG